MNVTNSTKYNSTSLPKKLIYSIVSQCKTKYLNFTPTDVPGDGNCFFQSLCRDNYFRNKGFFDHLQLQKHIIKEVLHLFEKKKNTFIHKLVDQYWHTPFFANKDQLSFDNHMAALQRDGVWDELSVIGFVSIVFPDLDIIMIECTSKTSSNFNSTINAIDT